VRTYRALCPDFNKFSKHWLARCRAGSFWFPSYNGARKNLAATPYCNAVCDHNMGMKYNAIAQICGADDSKRANLNSLSNLGRSINNSRRMNHHHCDFTASMNSSYSRI